jgi:phosphopantothenoylcysteine synthetase/decarboxylase
MPASKLQGKRVLITSGPMRAPIDAIRYIANTSTGELGVLLTEEALRRGARVTFLGGEGGARPQPDRLEPQWTKRLQITPVITFDDLMKVMSQELGDGTYDVVLHAMAVMDYVPEKMSSDKTPSGQDRWTITLVPTPKLIQMIKRWDEDIFLVGFKLEVGLDDRELVEKACRSAERSGADLMVANDLEQIQADRHPAVVIDAAGRVQGTFESKGQIAAGLWDLVEGKLKGER